MLKEFWQILLVDGPLLLPPPLFTPESGAMVDFYGVVRGIESRETIVSIRYEAHPNMAQHQLEKLASSAAKEFSINGLLLHHRIGVVPTSALSLFLRVSAKHREPAFAAAQWIVVQLKLTVPIWKHALTGTGEEIDRLPATDASKGHP